jgi:hypothetical protein
VSIDGGRVCPKEALHVARCCGHVQVIRNSALDHVRGFSCRVVLGQPTSVVAGHPVTATGSIRNGDGFRILDDVVRMEESRPSWRRPLGALLDLMLIGATQSGPLWFVLLCGAAAVVSLGTWWVRRRGRRP